MDVTWSRTPLTVQQFIEQFKHPQMVKIWQGENKRIQRFGELDLRQPFLMFKVYRSRKIFARAVGIDDSNGRFAPTGPKLIIPDNYPGWLALMLPDGRSAKYFESIGDVARAGLGMFLLQDSVVGLVSDSDGMNRKKVPHGQVLKVIRPYEDEERQKIAEIIQPDVMMYLQCMSHHGDLIYLPYSTRGRFYDISTRTHHTIDHVYLISNLLRVSRLPALARIIAGPKPNIALPLSNVVQLEEVRYETVILACAMVDDKPMLLEIDSSSTFMLLLAKHDSYLPKTDTFKRMMTACALEGLRWSQQMRIAHDMVPKLVPVAPKRSVSQISFVSSSHARRVELKAAHSADGFDQVKPRSSYSRFFSKKFWTFKKEKKPEYPTLREPLISGDLERFRDLKIKKENGSTESESRDRVNRRREPTRRRTRAHSLDDGYATSCADSIYNSIR